MFYPLIYMKVQLYLLHENDGVNKYES